MILGFAIIAVVSRRSSDRSPVLDVEIAYSFLGPSGEALRKEADRSLQAALGSLDTNQPGWQPASYVSELDRSQRLLRRAVLASVVDGRAMRSLSMTQLELGAIRGPYEPAEYIELLETARRSRLHDGAFQVDIASTYLRIGDVQAALPILHEVVAANPSLGRRAVNLLDDSGVDPQLIVKTLGDFPEVLYALETPFANRQMLDSFIDELGRAIPTASEAVIDFYGDVCERHNRFQIALDTLRPLTRLHDEKAAAARLAVMSRALLATNDFANAAAFARDAVQKSPQNPRYSELFADCSSSLGQDDVALDALHRSLSTAIAGVTSAGQRGRLYRKMGEIYERKGAGDAAYDAYRRALDLVPSDPIARERLRHITHEQVPTE